MEIFIINDTKEAREKSRDMLTEKLFKIALRQLREEMKNEKIDTKTSYRK